ncbi:hypothetical protein CcI49_15600 [Frankia sp. CcI49]|uniref:hypothetical protein n=1 Tax=unclassified Frankia TaxID=2632575 RepID=UPI0006CA133E|nr:MULTISPECIES: hypothetical protein [unclassified Frankia]KPM51358.1 hypothetical protein ACG83_35080 [Frankia sp. R43]ONH59414.1 hypothetical protein CcI49_15600 [Frankia sp. CcI49]
MSGLRRVRNVRRSVVGAIAAWALALLFSGCQEGGLVIAPPTTPAATPSVATAAPATGPAAPATGAPARDLRAGDYVLTAAPETAGFESSGGADDPDSSLIRGEVAECVGITGYDPTPPADETAGDTFFNTDANEIQASSHAKVLSASQIQQNADIVTSPLFGDCFRGALEEQLAGEQSEELTAEVVAVDTSFLPRGCTALVRTSMSITDQTGTYSYIFDTVYFYVGQVAVELTVTNIQDDPPQDTEQGFIDQIAGKLTNQ